VPSIQAKKTTTSTAQGGEEVVNVFSKKPKPIAQPTGILKQKGVRVKPEERYSVKEVLSQKETSKQEGEQQDDTTTKTSDSQEIVEIDLKQFEEAWKHYSDSIKAQHEMSFYTILSTNEKRLEGNTIELILNNSTQPAIVDRFRHELLNSLRTTLKAPALELNTVLQEASAEKMSLYTDKDKYVAMIEKNPALEKLRIALNLDIEF
jgi:hypothetical protein